MSAQQKGGKQQAEQAPRVVDADPLIASGNLANGVKYYIVTNTTHQGVADFILVHKSGNAENRDSAAVASRKAISDIPRFGGKSARQFLSNNGYYAAAKHVDGRISNILDNATVFDFGTLPIKARTSAVDSTIAMMFNILERLQNDPQRAADYSTSDNAIIISGDITKSDILTKLNLISLVLPKVSVNREAPHPHQWQPQDTMRCFVSAEGAIDGIATVSATYISPRTPDQYMGTLIPVVSEQLGDILSMVLKKRILLMTRAQNIPIASTSCSYVKSADTPDSESYQISLTVSNDNIEQAIELLASILSDIHYNGVPTAEFAAARSEYLLQLYSAKLQPSVENHTYVQRCLSDFLFGKTPLSDATRWTYLGKNDTKDTQSKHFSNFAKMLFDVEKNLTLSLKTSADYISPEQLKGIFTQAWTEQMWTSDKEIPLENRSVSLPVADEVVKLKVNSTKKEPVSGGYIWEFSNGVKVAYKRMETGGLFYYNLLLRGGYAHMDHLNHGEGAFLSGIIETYDIAGIKATDLHYHLVDKGIQLKSSVSLSDMSLYGTAPQGELDELFNALKAICNERSLNRDEFEYYRKSEMLRLKVAKGGVNYHNAVIDSLLSASFNYYSEKTLSSFYDDLDERAMEFFDGEFSRINDGILILVGDMNEDKLKTLLSKNLNGFKTTDGLSTAKGRVVYQPNLSKGVHVEKGESPRVELAVTAPYSYTSDHYFRMKLARVAIQNHLNRVLVGTGAYANVFAGFLDHAQDRAFVHISVENVLESSQPVNENAMSAEDLLELVRGSIEGMKVASDDLKVYKAVVKNEIASQQSEPLYWVSMIKYRYSDIKDFNTKYSDKIDATTVDQLNELLDALNEGSKVEIIVSTKD